MGLGRFELPTSRLSDISRSLVGAGERWKSATLTDSVLVSAGQRWWAMSQPVLQLQIDRRRYLIAAEAKPDLFDHIEHCHT
jgi:hypothetical protein